MVPLSVVDLVVAQHLPQGRRQAGDHHLHFYETRDNLYAGWADRVLFLRDGAIVDQSSASGGAESLLGLRG